MKITVAGMGYVGMANAVLLAQHHEVIAYDVIEEKVHLINAKKSPIEDSDIDRFFKEKDLNLKATLDPKVAFDSPDYVIISTPTNYDTDLNYFDTHLVESVVEQVLELSPESNMVIKSTIPVGLTQELREKYNIDNLYFSPEFLREGLALKDNLYPSRIIMGGKTPEAKKFTELLVEGAEKETIDVLMMEPSEAEAVKLFANTYLAMRVSFFNELDSFAEVKNLNTKDIINGVSLDPRIGNFYNNPSFGYGGYCLPKDSKQLLANYQDIPQSIIGAIVNSNETRKKHIFKQIIKLNPTVVGIYRLTMKANSDNFRDSAVDYLLDEFQKMNIKMIIFEPFYKLNYYKKIEIIKDLDLFKAKTDIIIANRVDYLIQDVKNKVYSRDIFHKD